LSCPDQSVSGGGPEAITKPLNQAPDVAFSASADGTANVALRSRNTPSRNHKFGQRGQVSVYGRCDLLQALGRWRGELTLHRKYSADIKQRLLNICERCLDRLMGASLLRAARNAICDETTQHADVAVKFVNAADGLDKWGTFTDGAARCEFGIPAVARFCGDLTDTFFFCQLVPLDLTPVLLRQSLTKLQPRVFISCVVQPRSLARLGVA